MPWSIMRSAPGRPISWAMAKQCTMRRDSLHLAASTALGAADEGPAIITEIAEAAGRIDDRALEEIEKIVGAGRAAIVGGRSA